MNRDMAFEQKIRDMLHRGECESYDQAEFKTRVKEGYARLGEMAQGATSHKKAQVNSTQDVKKKIAEEFRQKAMQSRKIDVQNYFDTPR